ncbi:DUF397 domain-containing protein [Kineosporia babensis]|uniref:DUF397 domain-containing protein n=1 Tax=Kineosporia babensis TaxID=499548 RepID=A0A9X1NHQ1_9ACTN|nr:DUF397 domain-containing protein [Kineosporia babensis]
MSATDGNDLRTGEVPDIDFHKSTFSEQGACVEVGRSGGMVHVRDTKNRALGTLSFTIPEWRAFVQGVQAREFDDEAMM